MKKQEEFPILEEEKVLTPEQKYPRIPMKAWRDVMEPGPCRSLSREEIEALYGRDFSPKSTS